MNKERLKLCKDFTNAKTIKELNCEKDELAKKIAKDIMVAVAWAEYKRRPWYKKLF